VLLKNPLEILTLPAIPIALVELGRGHLVATALQGLDVTPMVEAAKLYARGDFAAAADAYATLGHEFPAAYARLRAAESLLDEGRRGEADLHLDRALALFRSAGATGFIREGEALLAAAS
jgi:hypothetical protein